MDVKSIVSGVEKFAPLLAKVISSSNPIAGVLITLISHCLGVSEDDIPTALANDPDAESKIKQLEIQHQDLLLQTSVDDKASARQREEKIIELTGKRDWVIDAIAVLVIISFLILCIINYFFNPPDDHIITMMIGQSSGAFMMVLSYYFGSSSKD